MKSSVLWRVAAGGALVVLAVLAYLFLAENRETVPHDEEARPQRAAISTTDGLAEMREVVRGHVRKNGKAARPRGKRQFVSLDSVMFGNLPEADRKLCEAVQEALDADDAQKTIKLASGLMSSDSPEVRSHAVDALEWFGVEALPELTVLMGDADEGVAQNAINAWELAVSEIDDASVRLKISGMALKAVGTKDALLSIGAQFSNAATEYIDAEDDESVAFDRRVEVVQALVDMIDSPNRRQAEAGCELYEEITGHEWIDMNEAERYLTDPENYEPPEESGEVESATGEDVVSEQ